MKCPYCQNKAKWCDNKEVYGKRYGKSYMCYWCEDCRAYVGCHNNTRKPLGIMANKETRKWRMKVHSILDPLWQSGKMTRKEVYKKLEKIFNERIHIGESDIQRCKDILEQLRFI